MVIARCVIPVNSVFKTGLVDLKLSVDGGKNYPWWTKFYVCESSFGKKFLFEYNRVFQGDASIWSTILESP